MSTRLLSSLLLGVLLVEIRCQYQQVDVAPGEGTNPRGDSTGYTRSIYMDANQKFLVQWDFDSDGEHVTFEVIVRTQGWIGLGLSSNGGMAGADIAIGWVKDGQAFLMDCHATGEVEPELDDEQNYELLEASENNTHTVIKFRRKMETCDPQDKPIKDGTHRFIFAWSDVDPSPEKDILYHGAEHRGTRSVKIFADRNLKPDIPDDAVHMDFNITRYAVPLKDTTYWCEAMKIPKLDRKHHLIKIMPLIEPGNEIWVHHITLLACHGEVDQSYHGYTTICGAPKMPAPLKLCNEMVFTWTVGAPDFDWPVKAGYPMWGSETDPSFLLLEMHYDNPALKSGITDASGLRLIATPTLREFDSALLQQGYRYDKPFQLIPPHFPSITQYGYCPEDCLREAMKDTDDGIFVFANLLHMHLYGKAMRLRHFRGDKELPIIDIDEEYDFNLQETRHIQPAVNLKPGDALFSECIYTTEHISNSVLGGLSTSEEMCLSVFLYYPRTPLVMCESWPDVNWVTEQMSGVSVQEDAGLFPHFFVEDGQRAGQSWVDVLSSEDWRNESRRNQYQDIMDHSPYRVNCIHAGSYRSHNEALVPNRCLEQYHFPDTCGNQPRLEPRCESATGGAVCQPGSLQLMAVLGLLVLSTSFCLWP